MFKLEKKPTYTPRPQAEDNFLLLDWNENLEPINNAQQNIITEALLGVDPRKYPQINNNQLLGVLENYVGAKRQNICLFNGSDAALECISNVFLNSNSKVLLLCPDYAQAAQIIESKTRSCFYSESNTLYSHHFSKGHCVEGFDLVYLSNPNNPTGILYQPDFLEKLVRYNKSTIFVIDEAYYEYSNTTCKNLLYKYKNVIITRTLSKAFPMAGARFGYAISSIEVSAKLNKYRNCKQVNAYAQNLATQFLLNFDLFKTRINSCLSAREYYNKCIVLNSIDSEFSYGNFFLIQVKNKTKKIEAFLKEKITIREFPSVEILKDSIRVSIPPIHKIDKIISILSTDEI